MFILGPSRLNKEDAPSEVIDHGLKTVRAPPFDRVVSLTSRDDHPVGNVTLHVLLDHGRPMPFLERENNFSPALSRVNLRSEDRVEMATKTMKEVAGKLIAHLHQRIAGVNPLSLRSSLLDRDYVGVMMPEIRERCANIRQEFSRVATMEVPDCSGEHDNVAWGLLVVQNEFSHSQGGGSGAVS